MTSGQGTNRGPIDATRVPRFAGPDTFARLPRADEVEHADIAVLGIPFDSGVTYRPGARFGPSHIRQSSRLLRPYNPGQEIEPFATQQVVDAGDVTCNPFNIDAAVTAIELAASQLVASGTRLMTLGGDHTIALPLLRVMAATHGPIAVVHFDAHLDTWDTYFDAPITHGTPFRRASEEGLINKAASIHVGTRGPIYSANDLVDDETLGFQIIHALEMDDIGWRGVLQRIQDRVLDQPVYVSIDIDVLDPGFAPGTGTPEAGGLTSREVLAVLRGLSDCNLVSADVVEVSPPYDHSNITGIAAAHIAYELISAMAPRKDGSATS